MAHTFWPKMEAEVLIKYIVDGMVETEPKGVWIVVEVLMIISSLAAAVIRSSLVRITQAIISLIYFFELFRIAADVWMMRLS